MEINIHRKDQSVYYAQNQIRWKEHSKSSRLSIILFSIFGILVLAVEYFDNDKSVPFWNFQTTIGLAFLLMSIIYLYHFFKAKNQFFEKVELVAKHWTEFNTTSTLKLTDDSIIYKDSQSTIETKWTRYTSYKIKDDFIILIQVESFVGDLFINKSELSSDDFNTLLKHISALTKVE